MFRHPASNKQHEFDWDNTSIIAQAKQRHAMEAWYSNQNSINKHIELNPVYKSLRNRTGSVEIDSVRKEMEQQLINFEQDKELLQQKLNQVEQEAKLSLNNEKLIHDEDVERLRKEKESLHLELTSEKDAAIQCFQLEREDLVTRFEEEKEELNEEILSLQKERDESLIQAESQKQQ
eukprot:g45344.t1